MWALAIAPAHGQAGTALGGAHQVALLAQSRQESGLRIYSNVDEISWVTIVKAFNRQYPWIEVEALNTGPSVAFERYYTESAAHVRSADVLVVASPQDWLRLIEEHGIDPYMSTADAQLPAWSKPAPGLYTFSTDPMVLVYNRILLPERERVDSLSALADVAEKIPSALRGRITTYDPARHPFAYALQWTYLHSRGDAGWTLIGRLAPYTKFEGSGATMVEKLTTGEYVASFFTPGIALFSPVARRSRAKLLDWKFARDGTPMFERGVAVTKAAQNKASARLFLDFILSHPGQIAVGEAGLTPYRDDVKQAEVPFHTLQSIVDAVGASNIIWVGYDPALGADREAFLRRWKSGTHR